MKSDYEIARCGLVCFLCSESVHCGGCSCGDCPGANTCEVRKCSKEKGLDYCFECVEAGKCKKGIQAFPKPRAFTVFAKKYGIKLFIERLVKNKENGIVYHRSGVIGDYDAFSDIDEIINFLLEDKQK